MWVQSTLVDLIRQLAVKKDPKLVQVCRHCQDDRYTLLTWSCSRGFLQQTEGLSSLTPSPLHPSQYSNQEESIFSPLLYYNASQFLEHINILCQTIATSISKYLQYILFCLKQLSCTSMYIVQSFTKCTKLY